MVGKKGISAEDFTTAAMIIIMIVTIFSVLNYYIELHGKTELFTSISKLNELAYYSTSEKIFLRNAAKYSFAQASQEVLGGDLSKLSDEATKNAMEERFKIIFSAYLSALTKKDARITNEPKIDSVSFSVDSKEVYVKLNEPLKLGSEASYVLVDNRIHCSNCM